jgi:hypothetical protein
MIPSRLRYPRQAIAPIPGACEQLTRLVYELLDAHDDTARIVAGQHLDARWQAHLSYLRDLQRVAREMLACAGQQEGAQTFVPVDTSTREAGMFRRFGRPLVQVPPDVVDHAAPQTGKAEVDEANRSQSLDTGSGNKAGGL